MCLIVNLRWKRIGINEEGEEKEATAVISEYLRLGTFIVMKQEQADVLFVDINNV